MTDTDLITAPVDSDTRAGAATADPAADTGKTASRSGGSKAAARTGLSGMVLTELRSLAGELGIKGTSGMRKGDLIAAIKERQSGGSGRAPAAPEGGDARTSPAAKDAPDAASGQMTIGSTDRAADRGTKGDADSGARTGGEATNNDATNGDAKNNDAGTDTAKSGDAQAGDGKNGEQGRQSGGRQGNQSDQQGGNQRTRNRNRNSQGGNQQGGGQQGGNQGGGQNNQNNRDDDGEGGRGRRGRRFRERRRGRDRDSSGEPQVSEDDVLQPVAGILDVLDNYAFVRTSGYLAGQNDVYVSMNLVRRNGLRRGDAITGAVKVPREGEQPNQRQKFNPLVRLDTVNGAEVEAAKNRPEFNKLTPLYPNQRLRLETTPDRLSTRVIDLIMPIGKGQRALIVSPPKAGKTTILQDIANAITTNNPECHLMVVLVDERPEEVTDMQRSVRGEVIASTFDRPPSDHTAVAELAIERAKRLVEGGKDVVVLLDSITRLGRAYNNSSPASGRILSGGVDSTALYPPKRFLGAARNIENGGSLTIIATAMVETGSTGDTVIFEEFKGTGNAELKLDRKIAERRVFPAVDVNPSSTRKDELLLAPEEFAIVHKLRRVLSGLDSQQAIDLLMSQLKKTKTNIEFLMQVQQNAPGAVNED